jgi:TQXA domain-containing protein
LHNSFPTVDVTTLAKTVNAAGGLTKAQAVEGTQAAIWHLSDGVDLNANGNDASVVALYNYLVNNATSLPQPSSNPTLTVDAPGNTSGAAGDKIGPFTVHTNMGTVTVTGAVPPGVTIGAVDASGKQVALDQVTDGSKVYFDTSAGISPGSGSFTVSGDSQLGQLFIGKDEANTPGKPGYAKQNCKTKPVQSLIVAQSTTLSQSEKASWTATVTSTTPPPSSTTAPPSSTSTAPVVAPTTTKAAPPAVKDTSGSLPFTGVNVLAPVLLAVVLIGAGGGFLLLQRRRRRA